MRIPKRLPTTWKVPTVAIAEPTPAASEAPQSWRMPGEVARSQQREDRDHDHVGDHDREARLEEDPHAVAATHGDDPGHAPDEDVGGELEREAVRGPGQDRQHRRDHRGGTRAEEDRDEHRGAGARDEERQDGAARRELVGEGREEQHEAEQGERPGPVPELLPVAPRPGEQEHDDEHREQEPAGQAGDVQARLGEPERLELLDLEGRHLLAGLDDHLALLDRVCNRRDGGRGRVAGVGRQGLAVGCVRDEQRGHDLGRQAPLVVREGGREALAEVASGGLQLRVPERVALDEAEDAGRLGAGQGPPLGSEGVERLPRRRRQVRQRDRQGGLALFRGDAGGERRVDRGELGRQDVQLAAGQRGGRLRLVVVLRAGRRRAPPGGPRRSRSRSRRRASAVRGRRRSRGRPTARSTALRQVVDGEDGGQARDQEQRRPRRGGRRRAG